MLRDLHITVVSKVSFSQGLTKILSGGGSSALTMNGGHDQIKIRCGFHLIL